MYDHALDNNLGYVKYRFSFISKIPDYKVRKVVVPGISWFMFDTDGSLRGIIYIDDGTILGRKLGDFIGFKKWSKKSN